MRRITSVFLAALTASSAAVACGGQKGAEAPKGGRGDGSDADGATDHDGLADYVVEHGGIGTLGGSLQTPGLEVGGLHLDHLDPKDPVKLDGLLTEWPARTQAHTVAKGDGSRDRMGIAVQYDDTKLYVGAEITSAKLVRTDDFSEGEDHASLVLAFPTVTGQLVVYEVGLFAGKPGESSGTVRYSSGPKKGQDVDGAKIIEARAHDGYSFEAAFPWTAFPEASTVRVGLRGVARYYGAEAPGSVTSIIATGPGDRDTPTALPPLPMEAEQALAEQLLIPKKLAETAPLFDAVADVAGNAMLERVSVFDKYLTICGPSYLDGTKFYFKDLGAQFVSLDLRRVTGRPKADLLLRRRFSFDADTTRAATTRDWFEVLSVLGASEPTTVFAHEIAIASGKNRIDDDLQIHIAQREIDIRTDNATGWDASSYHEVIATDVEPVLLPWGTVKSQSVRFDGARYVKSSEVAQAGAERLGPSGGSSGAASTPAKLVEPATPPARPASTDLSKQVFDLYERDRHVAGIAPRFDIAVNVGGDARPERVVLVDRDIVIFGPGFKGGASYAYLTLAQFDDAADITDFTVRDLNGDGAADIIVRGTRRMTTGSTGAASSAGAPVAMDLIVVYSLNGETITRVFAAETGREQSGNRVQEMLQFIPSGSGRGFDILVAPARATGWTQRSYPWRQEPAGGQIEPLLLPWGGTPKATYRWDGTQFSRL